MSRIEVNDPHILPDGWTAVWEDGWLWATDGTGNAHTIACDQNRMSEVLDLVADEIRADLQDHDD